MIKPEMSPDMSLHCLLRKKDELSLGNSMYLAAIEGGIRSLKEGIKYRWHYMDENPEDIPITDDIVLVYYKMWQDEDGDGERDYALAYKDGNRYYYAFGSGHQEVLWLDEIIAWKKFERCK